MKTFFILFFIFILEIKLILWGNGENFIEDLLFEITLIPYEKKGENFSIYSFIFGEHTIPGAQLGLY